jgi:hypothetical protein
MADCKQIRVSNARYAAIRQLEKRFKNNELKRYGKIGTRCVLYLHNATYNTGTKNDTRRYVKSKSSFFLSLYAPKILIRQKYANRDTHASKSVFPAYRIVSRSRREANRHETTTAEGRHNLKMLGFGVGALRIPLGTHGTENLLSGLPSPPRGHQWRPFFHIKCFQFGQLPKPGMRVSFEVQADKGKGKLRAVDVKPIKRAAAEQRGYV